jgi:hypothetical protein
MKRPSHSTLNMEATGSSETTVPHCQNPTENNVASDRRDNLKYYTVILYVDSDTSTLKMEAASSSEKLITTYQTRQ